MPTESSESNQRLEQVAQDLAQLRCFPGPPKEFWPAYLPLLAQLGSASKAVLLLQDPSEAGKWKRIGDWSSNTGPSRFLVAFTRQVEELAIRTAQTGSQFRPVEEGGGGDGIPYMLAVGLRLQRAEDICIAAFLLPPTGEELARDILLRLELAADVPLAYQNFQVSRQARGDVEKFAVALDLMAQVNAEKRFLAAALAFCNGLATRFGCDRASLGWLERGYVRLRAISRTEKFDRQMAAAKGLEMAMDEALDQDDEVLWPAPAEATVVSRDHESFGQDQRVGHICSLPLRVEGRPAAVLTCERQSGPFTQTELQQLRLCCDQATPRLADLKHHDRWFGARWATWAKEQCAKLVGPEHTWAKIIALTVTVLLAVVFFVRVPYRVEGNFLLRSDEVSYLTAPFDGFISKVLVRPGDVVSSNGPLVSLDTSELELQQVAAQADLVRYTREAEKARAARALADMRIAESQAEQAKSRLALVNYRLEQATIKSPFSGVVVEGDLRERLAAPVKQGDALFKVARMDTLYVEAEINERDVHEVLGRTEGEIAFVSQPRLKYPIRILTVEPAAFPKESGNVFLVRCSFVQGSQPWWRPGMSGLCKLSADKRTLFWIFTHRTVDFLRMKLWW